jgi:hypothetical protein
LAVDGDVVLVRLECSLELIGKIEVIAAVRQKDCGPTGFPRLFGYLLVLRENSIFAIGWISARCCELGKKPALSNEMVRHAVTTVPSAVRLRAVSVHSKLPVPGEEGRSEIGADRPLLRRSTKAEDCPISAIGRRQPDRLGRMGRGHSPICSPTARLRRYRSMSRSASFLAISAALWR